MMQRLGRNCFDINFCCGPCDSKVEESPDRIFLKPNNGGRYARFTWQTTDGTFIDLTSVRMCRPCCHRYMEIMDGVRDHDAEAMEMMHRDATIILQKLDMTP